MIYRIEVRNRPRENVSAAGSATTDPFGAAVAQQIAELGYHAGAVQTYRVYLIDTDAGPRDVQRIATELLADPVVESSQVITTAATPSPGTLGEGRGEGASPKSRSETLTLTLSQNTGRGDESAERQHSRIEVHLKPGVMDPVAASTQTAIRDMGLPVRQVRTGRAYVLAEKIDHKKLAEIASRVLANGVIESVHFDRYLPRQFPALSDAPLQLRHVAVRELADEQLARLSREGHLFLSIDEMKAIQAYYRRQGREPTDIELETLAQTWSEHCVHKTLKSAVEVEVRDSSGKTVSKRHYESLIRDTIFDSTMNLMKDSARDFCLSVFADNAGVIAFDDTDAVCFKVETHNHPSAIEPYGGSATGSGGVIRDVLGTGLAAKPVANTDVFCVAPPDTAAVPKGVIHPKRILRQVVAGVRDYGNRMGIPTLNGAVYFDENYLGNPLVFCGCVGLIPRDKISKAAAAGDAIVVMGGRTGRDGIHGATFSSAELTDTHADEFSHAVQIGNAITEKQMTDVVLALRDRGLFSAITDCGAGGLSSAVGEMGETLGALVQLDRVPLKYTGLRHDEIWISEAQERMVLAVPPQHVQAVLDLAGSEDVEATVIGHFGTDNADLILQYGQREVGRLSMEFLHHGLPKRVRQAVVVQQAASRPPDAAPATPRSFRQKLVDLLASPNIASKHWIIRQYDHEVQGGSVIKPLIGPLQRGPSDAAVIRPKLDSRRGVVLGCGLTPGIEDPYQMALASIDEAVRNVVAVGADPDRLAVLDNFCWPSVDDEITMGTLVRACEACRDAALAYRIPFISGKDSLHNQFTNQETGQVLRIPRTLLISAIGVIDDIRRCITMDLKRPGGRIYRVACPHPHDLAGLAAMHRAVAKLIAGGGVAACHDISDGGLGVALAEMCIASGLGVVADEHVLLAPDIFAQTPGQYLIELADDHTGSRAVVGLGLAALAGVAEVSEVAAVQHLSKLTIASAGQRVLEIDLDELTTAWRGTLDW